MDNLQSYLPHLLWEAGESRGEPLAPFGEHEMREILDSAILSNSLSAISVQHLVADTSAGKEVTIGDRNCLKKRSCCSHARIITFIFV